MYYYTKMMASDFSKLSSLVSYNSHQKEVVGSPISAEYFDKIRKYLNQIGDFFANDSDAQALFKEHNLGYAGEMLERFDEREYFNNPLAVEALAVMASLMFVEGYSKKEMTHYEGQIANFGVKLRKNAHVQENYFVQVLSYLWELNHSEEDAYEENVENVLVALKKANLVDNLTAFERTFCRGMLTRFGDCAEQLHLLFMDSNVFAETFKNCGFQEQFFIITQLANDYEEYKWKKSYWSNDSMYNFVVNAWRLAKKNNLNKRRDLLAVVEKLGLDDSDYGTAVTLYLYLIELDLFRGFSHSKQQTLFDSLIFELDFFTKRNHKPTMYEYYLIHRKWHPRDNGVLDALSVLASAYEGVLETDLDDSLLHRAKMILTKAYKLEPMRNSNKLWLDVSFEFTTLLMNELHKQLNRFNDIASLDYEESGIIIPFDIEQDEVIFTQEGEAKQLTAYKTDYEQYVEMFSSCDSLNLNTIKMFMEVIISAFDVSTLLPLEDEVEDKYDRDALPATLKAIESVRLWFGRALYSKQYYNQLIAYDVHDLNMRTAEGIVKAFDLKLQDCIMADFKKTLDDKVVFDAMKQLGERVYDFITALEVDSFDNIADKQMQEDWIGLYLETVFNVNPFHFPNVMTNMYLHLKESNINVDFGDELDTFFVKVIEMKKEGIFEIRQEKKIGEYFKTDSQKLEEKLSEVEATLSKNHGENSEDKGYHYDDTFEVITKAYNFTLSAKALDEEVREMSLKTLEDRFEMLLHKALVHEDVQRMYMYEIYLSLDNMTEVMRQADKQNNDSVTTWWNLFTQKSAELRSKQRDLSDKRLAYYEFVKTTVVPLEAELKGRS